MKTLYSDSAKSIIEAIIPKSILDLNPVIAGGFIVAIYELAMKYPSDQLDQELLLKIKRCETHHYRKLNKILGLKDKFQDIDLWFLDDNSIWDSDSESGFLVGEFKEETPDPHTTFFNLMSYGYDIEAHLNEFKSHGLSHVVENSTRWANSLIIGKDAMSIQFIKMKYKSVEDLFSRFDIVNCCAAYYDGAFHFHEEFEESMESLTLTAGDTFSKGNDFGQIWAASRAFKYADRFSLEFSEEACDIITNTFMTACDLLTRINSDDYDVKNSTIELSSVSGFPNPYGIIGVDNIDKFRQLIENLLYKFPSLILMEEFDEDTILMFVSSKHDCVESFVKRYIENEEDDCSPF